MILGKNNPVSPSYQPVSLRQSKLKSEQNKQQIKTTNSPAAVPAAVCPSPPNIMPSVHGPRVHRRSSVSPNVVSRSASTLSQVRCGTGRTRYAHGVYV